MATTGRGELPWQEAASELRSRQRGLVRSVMWVGLGVGIPTAVNASIRAVASGEPGRAIFYLLAVTCLATLLVWRNAPLGPQAWGLIGILVATGVIELVSEGLSGPGRLFLLTAVGLSALLGSRYVGLSVLLISTIALVVVGWLFTSGHFQVPAERLANSLRAGEWFAEGLAFLLLAGMLFASQTYLIPALASALARSRSLATELQGTVKEREDLVSLQRAVFEATADGLLAVDLEGHVVSYNQRFASMWSLAPEAFQPGMDAHLVDIVKSQLKDPEIFTRNIESAYADPESERHDLLEFVDGRVFDRYSRPHRLGEEIVGRVWSFRDITDRVRAQRELAALNRELEVRVANRTRELEAFAYTVAHDLRAPLRSINGFTQILDEELAGRLGPEQQELFDRVCAASIRMDAQIDALLQLSRISRQELSVVQVDLAEIAQRVAFDLVQRYPGHEVDFKADVGLVVWGDLSLLEKLLENILHNAWKFTRGVEAPRVELRHLGFEGGMAYAVIDNGIGFDMEYSGVLFKPFWSAHGSAEVDDDAGIGLATAQRIVERHGGTIWAEAEPGLGATIFFTIGVPELHVRASA